MTDKSWNVKKSIDEWKALYRDGAKTIQQVFKTDKDSMTMNEDEQKCIDEYFSLLNTLCAEIREKDEGSSVVEEAAALFGDEIRIETKEQIEIQLRPFFGCAPLRKKEEKYRKQIEQLIDEIWPEYIIRRNPEHEIDLKQYEDLELSHGEMDEFIVTLCAVVDHCVSRILNYEGMVPVIQKTTGFSLELSSGIARKIDKENNELRINYIIKRLVGLSM